MPVAMVGGRERVFCVCVCVTRNLQSRCLRVYEFVDAWESGVCMREVKCGRRGDCTRVLVELVEAGELIRVGEGVSLSFSLSFN